MRRIITRTIALLILTAGVGCSENKGAPEGASSATPQQTAAVATVTATAVATAPTAAAELASAAAMASAAPSASAVADTMASAVAAASGSPSGAAAAPATSGTAAAGAKTYDCGAKGQKLCPMQAWMKGVMGSASASGDAAKLASAFATAAGKPPSGMVSGSAMANAGAAKAKAGDIDGAKATCKQCHDLYKEKYKQTMRDKPW